MTSSLSVLILIMECNLRPFSKLLLQNLLFCKDLLFRLGVKFYNLHKNITSLGGMKALNENVCMSQGNLILKNTMIKLINTNNSPSTNKQQFET